MSILPVRGSFLSLFALLLALHGTASLCRRGTFHPVPTGTRNGVDRLRQCFAR